MIQNLMSWKEKHIVHVLEDFIWGEWGGSLYNDAKSRCASECRSSSHFVISPFFDFQKLQGMAIVPDLQCKFPIYEYMCKYRKPSLSVHYIRITILHEDFIAYRTKQCTSMSVLEYVIMSNYSKFCSSVKSNGENGAVLYSCTMFYWVPYIHIHWLF